MRRFPLALALAIVLVAPPLGAPRAGAAATPAPTEADRLYVGWLDFDRGVQRWRESWAARLSRGEWTPANLQAVRDGWGRGVLEQLDNLAQAVRLDPRHARAHLALATLLAETGASDEAAAALDRATAALVARSGLDDAGDRDVAVGIARARAWLSRDAGAWSAGLAAADEGLRLAPDDVELRLVRGLLLAGAGRFAEAQAVARDLPPLEYRVYGWQQTGLRRSRSDYATRWILAMAYLGQGDARLARHVLGSVNPHRPFIPFMAHYWNDAALVHEAAGQVEDAAVYYALAAISLPHDRFFPMTGFGSEPRVLDLPDPRLPCFVSWRDDYVAGSLFTFAAQLAGECAAAGDSAAAAAFAPRAERALQTCLAFGINPLHSLSLRGQVRCATGRRAAAAADLAAARAGFAAAGRHDARTSMLLGILRLEDERFDEALACLHEAVAADSTLAPAWRSLGVALARTGDRAGARAAMDRSLRLEAAAPEGWYNRGVLAMEEQRWLEALDDLRAAVQLAPDDPRIVEALQLADHGRRRAGLEAPLPVAPPVPRAAPDADPPRPRRMLRLLGVSRGPGDAPDPATTVWADSSLSPERARAALATAEAEYRARPGPDSRRLYARACLRADEPRRARDLFADNRPELLPVEDLRLLLQADRALGEAGHAVRLATRVDPADPVPPDAELWLLVGLVCVDGGHREEGLRALDAAITLAPENAPLRAHRAFLAATPARE